MLLCLFRVIRKYLSRTEQFLSDFATLFFSTTRNGWPEIPFCIGLGKLFTIVKDLPPIKTVDR